MPNNSYLRSRRKEQQLVREFRKAGWVSARSAGSKSPIDVWAFHPKENRLYMVQVKTKKGGKGRSISPLNIGPCSFWKSVIAESYTFKYG